MVILKKIDDREKFDRLFRHFCKGEPKKTYVYGSYGEVVVEVYDKATVSTYTPTNVPTIYAGKRDMGKAFGDSSGRADRCRDTGNDLTSGHYTKPY